MAQVTITEFEKSLNALDEATAYAAKFSQGTEFKIARDACIQRFEFCVELAWKVGAKVIGSSSTGSRLVLRELFQNGLIQDIQQWFDFIDACNMSSHSYDEKIAETVFSIVTQFSIQGRLLLDGLKKQP